MRALACVSAIATLVGCSIVNNPSHRVGGDDAGFDAGTDDAGREDGGNTDGGGVDAGAVDAGEVDAGVVDAGDLVDAAPDGGLPRVEPGDYCQRYAEALCEAIPTCCSTADSVPPACVSQKRDSCAGVLAMAFTDSRTTYDPVRAAVLLEEVRVMRERCDTTPFLEWVHSRDGFLGAFVGSIARGDSCDPAADTDNNLLRVLCSDPNDSCQDVSGDRFCLATSGEGMTCTTVGQCLDGLRCVRPTGASLGTPGTCERMGEDIGSECRFLDECDSLRCSGNIITTGVCEEATSDWLYCPVP